MRLVIDNQVYAHLASLMSSTFFVGSIYLKDYFLRPLNPNVIVTQDQSGDITFKYFSKARRN